jgi:hypothetical protein
MVTGPQEQGREKQGEDKRDRVKDKSAQGGRGPAHHGK